MKIIVGLGNEGKQYASTFHNMGFMAADRFAEKLGAKFDRKECDSNVAVCYRGGEKIIIAKPLTFMNLSGVAVKQLLKKYKAEPKDLLVLYDDLDIPAASIRVRMRGSAGTHNGMRNIIAEIGTEDFARVRIGIGGKPDYIPLVNYVLSAVPAVMRPAYDKAFDTAAEMAIEFIEGKAKNCSA